MRQYTENILLEYQGYKGTLNYASHTNSYWGRVLITDNEKLVYSGKTRDDAQKEFEKLINHLIEVSNEI